MEYGKLRGDGPLSYINKERMGWLLLAVCCLTVLPFLGMMEFHTKGEPREAVVSLTMLKSGNWLLPTNNGGDIPYKPPMFHWLVAIFAWICGGHVTEYISRLPSALALIGLTLVTYRYFANRRGYVFAAASALVMFTCWEMHVAGGNARVDMLLTFFTVAAIFAITPRSIERHRPAWGAILLMSAAVLTKGPVGMVVPCMVCFLYYWMRGTTKFGWLLLTMFLNGVLALVIPFLWYWGGYMQRGQEFLDLVMEENFGRMTNTMSYDSCVHSWPYNFVLLLGGLVPWILLALMLLFCVRIRGKRSAGMWKRAWRWLRRESNPATALSIVGALAIFIFYCIPQSKRSVYLMPMYPFLAYLLTEFFAWGSRNHAKVVKAFGDIFAVAGVVLFALFIALKAGMVPDSIMGHGKHAADNVAILHSLRDCAGIGWLWAAVPVVLSAGWWWRLRRCSRGLGIIATEALLVMGIYVAMSGTYQPAAVNARSLKGTAAEMQRLFPDSPTTRIYEFISAGEFSKGDPVHFFELDFYADDRILNFRREKPTEGYLLISEKDAEEYMLGFEREGYSFTPAWELPKKVFKQKTTLYRFRK